MSIQENVISALDNMDSILNQVKDLDIPELDRYKGEMINAQSDLTRIKEELARHATGELSAAPAASAASAASVVPAETVVPAASVGGSNRKKSKRRRKTRRRFTRRF